MKNINSKITLKYNGVEMSIVRDEFFKFVNGKFNTLTSKERAFIWAIPKELLSKYKKKINT